MIPTKKPEEPNAFLKAFLNFAAFRGDSRFYTWLVRNE
jgi:DNA-directed RNA polymerase specialized sigma24 family protein